ncbi:MAG: hypothetical protein ACRENX_03210 [Candidatus Dormibacteria bacterium]
MSRTNVDIDETSCKVEMHRYELPSKRAAVNFPLRQLAAEISVEQAR